MCGVCEQTELLKSINIHKPDLSPYNAINQHIDKLSNYSYRVTKILISNVCKVLGLKGELKKAESDAPLIFQGRIQYSPKTHKPITQKEWKALESAIIKYLGIEKNEIQRRMIHDSMWLGNLIARMDKEQAKEEDINEMDLEEAGREFKQLNLSDYEKDQIYIAEQLGGQYLQDITESARSRINKIILNGLKEGKSKSSIFQALWDQEEDINRDWDRVIRTETAMNANNGLLLTTIKDSGEDYAFMKGMSSPGACKYCRGLIDGQVVVLVSQPPKSGETITIEGKEYVAIWPGKSNYGRKPGNYWTATIIHPYCYSSDTEVMTDEGWKFFYELNGKESVFGINPDTREVDWVKYSKIISYDYKGKLVNLKSKTTDLLVTNNHNNLVICKNKYLQKKTSSLVEGSHRIPKAVGIWEGSDKKFFKIGKIKLTTLQYVRFMAWYLSEGSTNRNNYINIAQNNIEKIYRDLIDLPVPVQKGKRKVYIRSNDLNKYVKKFGHSNEKYIPDELKKLNKKYLEEFLRIYTLGDGTERYKKCCIRGHNFLSYRRVISTSSKRMETDLSELMIKIGNFPSYTKIKKGRKSKIRGIEFESLYDVLNIHETYSKYCKFEKKEIEYNDKVYDIEMNKWHFFLTRRNGKASWSGNCRCSWSEWSLELENLIGG